MYMYTQQKMFCTLRVAVNFCLNKEWMHLMLYIHVYRRSQLVEVQTEIQGSFTKLCVFKVSRVHPSKVAKLPIMASGAESMEYLINL